MINTQVREHTVQEVTGTQGHVLAIQVMAKAFSGALKDRLSDLVY